MTLADFGAIGGILAGLIALGALIYGFVSFFARVNRIDRCVQALVIIHTKELIEFYKKLALHYSIPAQLLKKTPFWIS